MNQATAPGAGLNNCGRTHKAGSSSDLTDHANMMQNSEGGGSSVIKPHMQRQDANVVTSELLGCKQTERVW